MEPLKLPGERGFNIADHLRSSMDNSRGGGSTSPEVQQLLQDISTMMHAVSPTTSIEPPPLPLSPIASSEHINHDTRGAERRAVSPKRARKPHLRPRVAASFNLEPGNQSNRSKEQREPSEMDISEPNLASKGKPRVPQLNIGSSENEERVKDSPEDVERDVHGSDLHGNGNHSNSVHNGHHGSALGNGIQVQSPDQPSLVLQEIQEPTAQQTDEGKSEPLKLSSL